MRIYIYMYSLLFYINIFFTDKSRNDHSILIFDTALAPPSQTEASSSAVAKIVSKTSTSKVSFLCKKCSKQCFQFEHISPIFEHILCQLVCEVFSLKFNQILSKQVFQESSTYLPQIVQISLDVSKIVKKYLTR